ncbi:MAG TPA: uracil-DNA glycosylase [Nitrospiria bacterium]
MIDNLRAYIEMYRDWGLEGVSVTPPNRGSKEGTGRPSHQKAGPPVETHASESRTDEPSLSSARDASSSKADALAVLRAEMGDCTRCKLHPGRTLLVFGDGNPNAELMFVGEAPGEEEDRQGKPFVGRAGQLLTKIIEAMGLTREEVYIANIIKCRPPGNRNPEQDEIGTCSPFLHRQIEIIRPKVICALGTFSAQTLLSTGEKISRLRGRFHEMNRPGIGPVKVMPTFHPAYLLRNENDKPRVWEDMKLILGELNRSVPPPGRRAGGRA